MDELSGRTVVITGAGNGIGRSLARCFASAGCRLALADIDAPALGAVKEELLQDGCEVMSAVVDVTRPRDFESFARSISERFGGADVLINNAGVAMPGRSLSSLTVSDWRWVLDVNLMGAVHAIEAFMPLLSRSTNGHIVIMASMTAFDAGAYNGPYCASKAALLALSETLALECEYENLPISVSVVCPGAVRTSIARSNERRPTAYDAPGHEGPMPEAMTQFLTKAANIALSPEAIADHVLDAVRTKRFYVITHENSEARLRRRAIDATSSDGALTRL